MDAQEIIERIMSQHWDFVCCDCWICENGRALGYGPRDKYLEHKSEIKVAHVSVPQE